MAEKTRNMKRIAVVLGAGVACSAISMASAHSAFCSEPDQKAVVEQIQSNAYDMSEEEISLYTPVLREKGRDHNYSGSFALYDLDGDGVRELIISTGENDADWVNYVYTIKKGEAVPIGNFYASVVLYETEDGRGIYSVYNQMGCQIINRIIKQDDQIVVDKVMETGTEEGQELIPDTEEISCRLLKEWASGQNAGEESADSSMFLTYEGYYMSQDTGREIHIYEQNSPELGCEGILDVTKSADAEAAGISTYFLRAGGGNTAVIVDSKKGTVLERGTIEFHENGLYILWDTGDLTGTYYKISE